MTDYEMIREEGRFDDVGTVRVSESFGTIAVYIKVDEDRWHTVYVDPLRRQVLSPGRQLSDAVATGHPIVFAPKSVV
jgi:hypothetical protein